jgi:phosphatidylinositol-3-phosphatase
MPERAVFRARSGWWLALCLWLSALAATCGPGTPASDGGASPPSSAGGNRFVFVIAMENRGAAEIYESGSAPYINGTLIPHGARASSFADELPSLPSEPHYVWMEAGTNVFPDHTFTSDDAPTAANSTASPAHLVAQIGAAGGGLDWIAYQEGIAASEPCPISATGLYTPAHQPFVFFQDVSGAPPSSTNATCAAHHRPLAALASDVSTGAVASYNFISPNACHDMHGAPSCPDTNLVRAGDDWLAANLPPLVAFVETRGGVVFIVWDEGEPLPFLAVGPHVKPGYTSAASYNHGSILKSVEKMLGLPVLDAVASANDLGDMFVPGSFP